jgi:hypothetical protein
MVSWANDTCVSLGLRGARKVFGNVLVYFTHRIVRPIRRLSTVQTHVHVRF